MSFQYTSGDPTHLVGGTNASMADIQGPFTDLKTFLNARIAAIPTLVSSLPVAPVDGQECYFLADATNGVVWHLRYRSASGSTYKWEFVGGAPLVAPEVTVGDLTNSVAYVDLPSAGPSITVPLAGDYLIAGAAQVTSTTAAFNGVAAAKIGATATSDADTLVQAFAAANQGVNTGREIKRTVSAASTVVKMQYRAATGTSTQFSQRTLEIRPIRVG